MTKAQIAERDEARARLREMLPPGSKVHTIMRHVSRSGMMRHIDVYALNADGKTYLSGYVAKAIDARRTDRGEIKMGGCGMDMGFAIVNELSYALYPDSFECIGERCPANDHFNGDRDYTPHMHSKGAAGYALRQEWL